MSILYHSFFSVCPRDFFPNPGNSLTTFDVIYTLFVFMLVITNGVFCIVAPTAGRDESVTFTVGDELSLTASFFGFNLALDDITWTQNTSLSLVDRVTITNSDLSGPNTTSTLTILSSITGVTYAGIYVATAINRAGNSSTTFNVVVTGKKCIFHSGCVLNIH